jgi:hypothetical protein
VYFAIAYLREGFMRFQRLFLVFLFLGTLNHQNFAYAEAGDQLKAYKTFTLTPGTPLFEEMDREGGIADVMDEDAGHRFTIGDYKTAKALEGEFSPEVRRNFLGVFADGEEGFKTLINELEGKKYTAATITGGIARALESKKLLKRPKEIGLSAAKLTTIIEAMSQDAGTEIPLGPSIRTFHYNYKKGIDKSEEESEAEGETREMKGKRTKSGRSYIDTGSRRTHDPSDRYFLTETAEYFEKAKNPWPLYDVMLGVLTESDAAGVEDLTKLGQTVLGDWFGIYIAEQRRHRMTGWTKKDWENALTELLMLAPYTKTAGHIRNRDGEIVDGELVDYFGIGKQGSGLGGKAGMERRKLQRQISNIMAEIHPDEHSALAGLIGAKKGSDLCSGLMKFLNDGKNQGAVRENAGSIQKATVDYLKAMSGSASEIAGQISN